ncbi:filamentous haemagglutinin family protein [Achromobacter insuavis]|uniref:filamentous haemagglutinin family protein n=1 Tax=Achromobacter insuavis TaxID=1287735 RepID=UPI000E308EFE
MIPEAPAGDVGLIAPRGTIDTRKAGIRPAAIATFHHCCCPAFTIGSDLEKSTLGIPPRAGTAHRPTEPPRIDPRAPPPRAQYEELPHPSTGIADRHPFHNDAMARARRSR